MWEKSIQGHILGAFFYGYTVSQIPGGLMAEQFGGKWVVFGFLGLSSVATLLTPVAARFSFAALIVLRVFVGIGSVSLTRIGLVNQGPGARMAARGPHSARQTV